MVLLPCLILTLSRFDSDRIPLRTVWSPDQQHRQPLGICQKCRFSGPTPEFLVLMLASARLSSEGQVLLCGFTSRSLLSLPSPFRLELGAPHCCRSLTPAPTSMSRTLHSTVCGEPLPGCHLFPAGTLTDPGGQDVNSYSFRQSICPLGYPLVHTGFPSHSWVLRSRELATLVLGLGSKSYPLTMDLEARGKDEDPCAGYFPLRLWWV